MATTNANNRIAKNTIFLYVRKIIVMAISLYTSRILLRYLGVDDFGLYGLVGSVVMMFISLRSTFASSIQRYLNVDRGQGGLHQQRIFITGVVIHLVIALVFIIVTDTVGTIFLPEFKIAPEKLSTAFWVLQFSVLSGAISIICIPYDAVIIANERFDALAIIQIIDAVLRLGVIFLLGFASDDRVVMYSMFLVGVALSNFAMCFYYSRHAFGESVRLKYKKDKSLLIDMTKFAGWNFFGNAAYYLTNEGVNFILNFFGGIVANAARTISYQVKSALQTFIGDITVAFLPQTIAAYKNDKERFYSLQFIAAKFRFMACISLCIPLYVFTKQILVVWLEDVPDGTILFIKWILIYLLVRTFHDPIDSAFKAANKLKHYQIAELIVLLSNLPISLAVLKLGAPLWSVFVVMSIVEAVNLIVILILGKRILSFRSVEYAVRIILPSVLLAVVVGVSINLFLFCNSEVVDNFGVIIAESFALVGYTMLLACFILFSSSERKTLIEKFKHRKTNHK